MLREAEDALHATLVVATLVIAVLAAGCRATTGRHTDGGVGSGGDGAILGPLVDAAMAAEPCALHAGATSVARACVSNTAYTSCPGTTSVPCGDGYACAEWVDGDGTLRAACVDAGETTICDPKLQPSTCDGATAVYCNAIPVANPPDPNTPPGWLSHDDCTKTWAPDATCHSDGNGPYCTSASDVPCDPSTFVASCTQICQDQGSHSAMRPFSCGSGAQCVQNATCTSPICVPATATSSALPPTVAATYAACPSATTVRLEQCGLEWVTSCGSLSADGSSTQCYAPASNVVECISPSDVTCNPATAPPSCIDAQTEYFCTAGWVYGAQTCLQGMVCRSGSCCDPTAPSGLPMACPM